MTFNPTRMVVCVLPLALAVTAGAADLPQASQEMLKKLKMTEADLAGLDKELAIPQAWIDGARQEGTLRVRLNLSDKHFQNLAEVFNGRYPDIEIEYTRGVGADRAVKPLLAYRSGRYITDIVSGFTGKYNEYMAADALARVDDMPAWNSSPAELRDPEGRFLPYQQINWCTSYNTNKVKKAELPQTWEEILTNPRWRGGKVGVANRPQLWLAMIWQAKGAEYATDYMNRLFRDVKPQLRKEAINGMMKLASIGEFDLAIPSAGYRVKIQVERGAPIAFHCPEPVPGSVSMVAIFKGTPQINKSKIFLNWLVSKEGQIALHNASGVRPSHVGLQELSSVLPYPDAVKGKKVSFRTLETMKTVMKPMYQAWNKAWAEHGGPARKRR